MIKNVHIWIITGLIGLILGIYSPITQFQWIILFIVGLIWHLIAVYHQGKPKFWKFIAHNPEEAYKYFKEKPDVWTVLDTPEIKKTYNYLRNKHPENKKKWVGPYRLFVPSIGFIQIFGRADVYEQEQERLIEFLNCK